MLYYLQMNPIKKKLKSLLNKKTQRFLADYYARGDFLKEKFTIPFPRYSIGDSERTIEYPWCLSQAAHYTENKFFDILDIGYVRASKIWVEQIKKLKQIANVHLVDVRPKEEARVAPNEFDGFTIYQDDILDFKSPQRFDIIFLISVLEHFGKKDHLINLPYGAPPLYTDTEGFEDHTKDYNGLKIIAGLLKDKGKLLVTVPFGHLADYGSHIIYDRNRVELLKEKAGLREVAAEFFKYADMEGWSKVEEKDLKDALYQQEGAIAANGLGCFVFERI